MAKKTGNTPEQEAVVLAVTKTCRGPYLISEERQQLGFEAWRAVEDTDEKGARQLIKDLIQEANNHTPSGMVLDRALPEEEGNWPALKRIALPLIRLRGDEVGQGCGWDLNEEILKHPFDGAEHMTDCPQCGIEISWKAPVFYDAPGS